MTGEEMPPEGGDPGQRIERDEREHGAGEEKPGFGCWLPERTRSKGGFGGKDSRAQ